MDDFALPPDVPEIDTLSGDAQSRLRSFIERLERLAEDLDAVRGDTKEVFSEAKGEGFDTRVLRAVLQYRREDKARRQELDALVDLYLSALGEA